MKRASTVILIIVAIALAVAVWDYFRPLRKPAEIVTTQPVKVASHIPKTFEPRIGIPLAKQMAEHPGQTPREDLSRADMRLIMEFQATRIKELEAELNVLRASVKSTDLRYAGN